MTRPRAKRIPFVDAAMTIGIQSFRRQSFPQSFNFVCQRQIGTLWGRRVANHNTSSTDSRRPIIQRRRRGQRGDILSVLFDNHRAIQSVAFSHRHKLLCTARLVRTASAVDEGFGFVDTKRPSGGRLAETQPLLLFLALPGPSAAVVETSVVLGLCLFARRHRAAASTTPSHRSRRCCKCQTHSGDDEVESRKTISTAERIIIAVFCDRERKNENDVVLFGPSGEEVF